jgi:3-oxoacyl-[acyl-carrier-protein] synthase-1
MAKVLITGLGVVSSIGLGVDENLAQLKLAKTGIQKQHFLKSEHSNYVLGEVKHTTQSLIERSGLSDKDHSRTIALGALAAKEAVEMAQLSPGDLHKAVFISATTVAGMDRTEKAYKNYLDNGMVESEVYRHHPCQDSTDTIAKHLGVGGLKFTISTACSSSANAIMQGARMIKSGRCEIAIVGGTDAMSLFTFNGFRSLQILDEEWCRPFDITRVGLNLGEGAAYIVLESEVSIARRQVKAIAAVSGYGNANDAFHQTASSPEGDGATLAMQTALDIAGLAPQDIDYVNAHGTATQINDSSESNAFKRVFGANIPPYSSTKAYTGHTLAAAGSIEAVYSILSLQEQCVFPSLNCKQPIEDIAPPVRKVESAALDHVLSNSLGFGGNSSTIILSKL